MAIWKITCPECEHCEEIRIDIADFPKNEQKEYLDKILLNKFKNIVLVVEKQLKMIKNDYNDFDYQEYDPDGGHRASKGYKEYNILLDELNEFKKLIRIW